MSSRTVCSTLAGLCCAIIVSLVPSLHGADSAVLAQRALIDPATVLPILDDLPARFVNRPLARESVEESRARLALKMFERTNPGSPQVTRLVVTAAVATDNAVASGVLASMRAQLEGRGWSFQRSNGLIGDEAIVGRLTVGGPTSRSLERVLVAFRKGAATGSADWEDFADQPNHDAALEIARIIEGRIVATRVDAVVPEPTARPELTPTVSDTSPTPPRSLTPTPTPTASASPTPASEVIPQLPR